MHQSLLAFVAGIGIPAVVLWIILINARVEGFIPNVSWEVIFIPVYILLLSWLVFIIFFSRERIITHLATFSWVLSWLLISAFVWMTISTLDNPEPTFSWSMVLGPLVILFAISAIFELTTLIGLSFGRNWWKSNNTLLKRRGAFHILVWLISEISLLVFVSLLGRKLDLLPEGPSWGVIFIPVWFAFASMFAVLTTECALAAQHSSNKPIRRNTVGGLVAFFLSWISLLVFTILLNVALEFPDKISVWGLTTPVFVALSIFEIYACASRENLTSDEFVYVASPKKGIELELEEEEEEDEGDR